MVGNKNLKKLDAIGAIIGLVTGCISMTSVMLLWNYLLTPLYLGYPREAVVKLILPAFLPFNLLKSSLNAAITMLLYKPVVTTLRKSNLVPESDQSSQSTKINVGVMLASLFVLFTCILIVLALNGYI